MPARSPFTQLCQHLAQLRAESQRADLHLHTLHSDGEFSPAELVRRAKQRGLGAIAVTDHDTTAGLRPAIEAAKAGDGPALEIVPGVEITCAHRGRELHLLGYFFRPDDPALGAALAELQAHRRQRFAEMMDRLPAEVRPTNEISTAVAPGRRSLAVLLVRQGKVKTVGEAFARFLGDGGPASVPNLRLPVDRAIGLLRAAGGAASWAHPPPNASLEEVLELRDMGLSAVEAIYPTFTAARSRQLRGFAQAAGLAVSGGSDCHGPAPASRAVGTWGVTLRELDELRRQATA